MRLLLSFFLFLVINYSAVCCFCAPFNFCKHLEIIEDNETVFIFMGSYIQEESLPNYTKAVQFKIEKVYNGEVVKPNSQHYSGEAYTNTDSTIWVLAGSEDGCLRNLNESDAIFALTYQTNWPAPNDSVGYVPSVCYSDYFPISDDQTITGKIYPGDDITMDLTEFEGLISNSCNSTSTFDYTNSNQIKVYPNPISDVLNIQIKGDEDSWKITLYDTEGNKHFVPDGTQIDMNEFESGIYFLSFRNETIVITKKVVKI